MSLQPSLAAVEDAHVVPENLTLTTRGIECSAYRWNPPDGVSVRGVAVVYHGFGAHSLYPTVRYASSLLCEHGLVVYALDLPGHGASPGTRGLLTSVEDLIEDGMAVATYAAGHRSKGGKNKLPLFLVGSSMGGAISLAVSQRMKETTETVAGVVLLAPMLSLNVSPFVCGVLRLLSYIIPTAPLLPSSATSSKAQYRDEEKRAECDRNTMTYKGSLRPQSALVCVDFTNFVQDELSKIDVAFLCMIAEEDCVVDNTKAKDLIGISPSQDKTIKSYAALHGLLCEPAPLIGIIESDIIDWIDHRL